MSAEAVRAVLEALDRGEGGAALAFAERLGESRERVLLALQALLGMLRQAARGRLGAEGGEAPPLILRLGAAELGSLLAGALETQRRLEGDRPPNAKLALDTLLLGAGAAGGGSAAGAAGVAAAGCRGGGA